MPKRGLGDLKVTWATFRSSDVMNDALLSASVDFVCLGVPGIATIWGRPKVAWTSKQRRLQRPAAADEHAQSNIKSIRDLTEKDKIAMPAVKVSQQAILLQMATAQVFGEANYAKLDGLTVSMSHPDAMATFLSGGGEINNHFTSPPFMQKELEKPGISKVLNSVDYWADRSLSTSSQRRASSTMKIRNSTPCSSNRSKKRPSSLTRTSARRRKSTSG